MGVDVAMGGLCAFGGPPGWAISSSYYIIDATIGKENAIQSYMIMTDVKFYLIENRCTNFSDYKY